MLSKYAYFVLKMNLHLPPPNGYAAAVDGNLLVLRPWLGIRALELIEKVRFFWRYFCFSPRATEMED